MNILAFRILMTFCVWFRQPTISDVEGNINNLIDVSDFKPYRVGDDVELQNGVDIFYSSYLFLISNFRCAKIIRFNFVLLRVKVHRMGCMAGSCRI